MGIVKERLQQQRVAARNVEVAAAARHGVQMDRKPEPAAFVGDVVKQIILQELVTGQIGPA